MAILRLCSGHERYCLIVFIDFVRNPTVIEMIIFFEGTYLYGVWNRPTMCEHVCVTQRGCVMGVDDSRNTRNTIRNSWHQNNVEPLEAFPSILELLFS